MSARLLRPFCLTLLLASPWLAASEPEESAASEAAEETVEASTETAAEPVRPAFPERTRQTAAAFGERLDGREQQWLEAGEERFLALWHPANSGKPKGLVLMLPSDLLPAETPAFRMLREGLADAGWHALSLTLPDPLDTLPPPRAPEPASAEPSESPEESGSGDEPAAEDAEPAAAEETPPATESIAEAGSAESETGETAAGEPVAEEQASEEPEAPLTLAERQERHAERVFARLDAALGFASAQPPGRIVLLGQGSGAYWVARYLRERKPETVIALALIEGREANGFGPPLDQLAPGLGLPVGDLYYRDQPAQERAARLRSNQSKRVKNEDYRQVALVRLLDAKAEHTQLLRRLRGWLERLPQPGQGRP